VVEQLAVKYMFIWYNYLVCQINENMPSADNI
jgi:hypothetical protein